VRPFRTRWQILFAASLFLLLLALATFRNTDGSSILDIIVKTMTNPTDQVLMVLLILGMVGAGHYRLAKGTLALFIEIGQAVKVLFLVVGFYLFLKVAEAPSLLPWNETILFVMIFLGLELALRFMFRAAVLFIRGKGIRLDKTLIIGTALPVQELAVRMVRDAYLGYELIGFLDQRRPSKLLHELKSGFDYLGTPGEYGEIYSEERFKVLIIGTTTLHRDLILDIVEFCRERKITLFSFPQTSHFYVEEFDIDSLAGFPFERMRGNPARSFLVIKRIGDILVAAVLSVLFLPLMALILFLQMVSKMKPHFHKNTFLSVSGPPLFHGRILNLETRYVWIRPIFKVLFKLQVDFLPLLYEVFRGKMSIVGPRAEMGEKIPEYFEKLPSIFGKSPLKSGLTGWAQIHKPFNKRAFATERMSYDLYYLENASMSLDLAILFRTFYILVFQKSSPAPSYGALTREGPLESKE